ncbi:uncharacterized protein LOC111017897 [Momordica charantia]|uniref:Uncharacterized protein LOC111017897 n=1 Tax=Momordica charantia TaxID=3673 RepID=A0A6J1D829_MOMCH|nr:uncharacterized protein LOC111017897 [Momordica charantia]
MQDSLSSSSLHIKQGGAGAGAPLNDFDDIKLHTDHHDHHQHHQHLKFHPHHHDLLHHSEEAMLKMDNVMLKEDSDPIQQAQEQDLKGAVDTLFTFSNSDT